MVSEQLTLGLGPQPAWSREGANYERDPLEKPARGTCPACLREVAVTADGAVVRHGWKESGRRRGVYGQGIQWGRCMGTGLRPLEETDADLVKSIQRIEVAIRDARRDADWHESEGADEYVGNAGSVTRQNGYGFHPDEAREKFADRVKEAAGQIGVSITVDHAVNTIRYREEKVDRYEYCAHRGFQGVALRSDLYSALNGGQPEIRVGALDDGSGGRGRTISRPGGNSDARRWTVQPDPTDILTFVGYETLRAQYVARLRSFVVDATRRVEALEDAGKHHMNHPSRGIAPPAPVVHWARSTTRRSSGQSGLEQACKRFTFRADGEPLPANWSADKGAVTCVRCRKKIDG